MTIVDLALSGELLGHIGITLCRVIIGFAIGSVIATVLGALTGYSVVMRELFDPLLQSLRNIPSLAWVPLFILWMGIYEPSKITLCSGSVLSGLSQSDERDSERRSQIS